MVGRYPFRDPNRIRPEESLGNRRDRDENAGNRIERPRERDENAGNRVDRTDRQQRDSNARRPRERTGQEEATVVTPQTAAMIDMNTLTASVEALVRLVKDNGIDELQVENGPFKLTVRCGGGVRETIVERSGTAVPIVLQTQLAPEAPTNNAAAAAAAPLAPAQRPAALPETHPHSASPQLGPGEQLITSPMVGTFYSGPSPKDAPFVTEGDLVEQGQTVGIIEAMKMMNPIEAETAGRVVRILVSDSQTVEYGQPLLVIAES